MNKAVIVNFGLTIVSLIILWAYAFGPLAGTGVVSVNPSSLQPTATQATVGNQNVAMNAYRNRDLAQNYYAISFPQAWKLQSATKAGGYDFVFSGGSGSSHLQDVADNTTLGLFVLSQAEPDLKKTLAGYHRISYQKIVINGNGASQLTYGSTASSTAYETVKTYITGADHAAVVTLTARESDFTGMQPLFDAIVNSFQWEK